MKNVKKIVIEIPSEKTLKLIKTTPTLSRLFRGELNVGFNNQIVNHKQYSDIVRLIGITGCRVFS